jgi:hypothetical protein
MLLTRETTERGGTCRLLKQGQLDIQGVHMIMNGVCPWSFRWGRLVPVQKIFVLPWLL